MNYIVKLYSSMGLVLAEYHVLTGTRIMAVELAMIQHMNNWRHVPKQQATHFSVRICEEYDIPVRI